MRSLMLKPKYFKQNRLYRFFYLAAEVASIIEDLSNLQIPSQIKYALSVQAGAGLIAPHAVYKEVHIYVADEHGIEFLKDELQLKEADQGSNMVLMRPYYKHSVFYNHQIIDGLPVVSDIQLYLDLYGYPVRGREQAGYLYDKRLKAIFDEPR